MTEEDPDTIIMMRMIMIGNMTEVKAEVATDQADGIKMIGIGVGDGIEREAEGRGRREDRADGTEMIGTVEIRTLETIIDIKMIEPRQKTGIPTSGPKLLPSLQLHLETFMMRMLSMLMITLLLLVLMLNWEEMMTAEILILTPGSRC